MDGRFDVTRAGLPCGVAELSQNGLMLDIKFSGNAPDSENVYRLAAVCNGRYIMLGVPVPDNSGKLTLTKKFSKSSLRELGFDSPEVFELVLPNENHTNHFEPNTVNTNETENANNNNKPDNEPENESEHEKPTSKPDSNVHDFQPKVVIPEFQPKILVPDEMPIQRYNTQRQNAQRQSSQKQNMQRNNTQKQNPWVRGPQRENTENSTENTITHEKPPEKPAMPKADTKTWKPVANPAVMFAENGVLSSADEIKGALISEEGEFIHLAVPVSEGEPFPLMSAFCLGEPQTINNGEYIVFKLKNGAFTA